MAKRGFYHASSEGLWPKVGAEIPIFFHFESLPDAIFLD